MADQQVAHPYDDRIGRSIGRPSPVRLNGQQRVPARHDPTEEAR